MKNITYIIVFLLCGSFAFAQNVNYNGVRFEGDFQMADPTFVCNYESGMQQGRIFRDGVAANCPGKACPGDFNTGSTFNWASWEMSNLLTAPQCVEIAFETLGCGFNGHSAMFEGPYTPPAGGGQYCANNMFLGDVGSSLTQSYFVEIPGAAMFSQVNNTNFDTQNCNYAFTIFGDVGCGGEPRKPLSGGTSVPTMTQWGLFLFGLIMLTLGVVYVYNMSVNRVTINK